MTDADLAEFVDECPLLFHMSAEGAWPSIRDRGLLSASALLDLASPRTDERAALESRRRSRSVPLPIDGPGQVVLRDQNTMTDAALEACLDDGLAPADWYRILNRRAFFWTSRTRLGRLLNARSYAAQEHDVIEVDTASLLSAHRPRVTLAAINTGSTIRAARRRGLATFLPIADYPYAEWKRRRGRGERVVELAVLDGVPDIEDHTVRVLRMKRDTEIRTIWRRNDGSLPPMRR